MNPRLRELIKDAASYFQEEIASYQRDYEYWMKSYSDQFVTPRWELTSYYFIMAKASCRNRRKAYISYWICMAELLRIPIDIETDEDIYSVLIEYGYERANNE